MPIYDKRDPNSWYNSIPTRYQNEMPKPDKFTEALLSMDVFDIDKLDNEYIRPDRSIVAKIPRIENRIDRWETGEEYGEEYVDLIIGRNYDPETQQMIYDGNAIGKNDETPVAETPEPTPDLSAYLVSDEADDTPVEIPDIV